MLREVLVGVVPLIGLITATLGSILGGLATPTEAAGIGTRRRPGSGPGLSQAQLRRAAARPHLDDVHDEHGAAAGGHIQHLRRGVRPAGNRELDHQHAAVIRSCRRCSCS